MRPILPRQGSSRARHLVGAPGRGCCAVPLDALHSLSGWVTKNPACAECTGTSALRCERRSRKRCKPGGRSRCVSAPGWQRAQPVPLLGQLLAGIRPAGNPARSPYGSQNRTPGEAEQELKVTGCHVSCGFVGGMAGF
jgi:hypothetical protein